MKKIPLIVEKHPANYSGYPFITLIEYDKAPYVTLVDNCTESVVTCYSLDKCAAENIDEMAALQVAMDWYETDRAIPLSVYISKNGLTGQMQRILTTFQTEFITRVIGPLPQYNFTKVKKVRRRRKRSIAPAIKVVHHIEVGDVAL